MTATILIHGAWWVFGFVCGIVAMAVLTLGSVMSLLEELPVSAKDDDDDPEPEPVNAELAEAKDTAAFYQALYLDTMRSKM